MKTKNTQRNWRLAGYLLIEIGGGFLFGTALALASMVQVLTLNTPTV